MNESAVFYVNFFKLYMLAAGSVVVGVLFASAAISHEPGPEAPAVSAIWAAALALVALGIGAWRQAADRSPLIEVSARGIHDRLHGDIPWDQVANYRMHASFFNPCFGYNLKTGALPPRNAVIYRALGAMNRVSGLPRRNFKKPMIVGGTKQMLEAFRHFRPDLEAT